MLVCTTKKKLGVNYLVSKSVLHMVQEFFYPGVCMPASNKCLWLIALLCVPIFCEYGQAKPAVFVLGGGGYGTYAMNDLYNELDFLGDEAQNIQSGLNYTAGLRFSPTQDVLIALYFHRLTGGAITDQYGVYLDYDISCNIFEIVPMMYIGGDESIQVYSGLGLSIVQSMASANAEISPNNYLPSHFGWNGSLDGRSFGARVVFEALIPLNEALQLVFYGSYRVARVEDVTVNDHEVDLSLDWSGIAAGAGFVIRLPQN